LSAKAPRLNSLKDAEAVQRYQQGETVRVIAVSLGVDRTTVSRHLRLQGVRLRGRPLSERQVKRATSSYRRGASLAVIGQDLGVDSTTVWRALVKAGVPMRDPHGRQR
jgi:hypothetical protein